MVVEELGQEARREAPALCWIGRPHGRHLRADQALDERVREALLLEPCPERDVVARLLQQFASSPVEPRQVGHHPVKPRRHQVGTLCEQPVGRSAGVLEVARCIADAEAHRRRLRPHSQLPQQPLEAGVVAVVEDDEAGVDRERLIGRVDPDGVGVPAGIVSRLEHSDLMPAMKEVCDHEARYAGSYDRDLHPSIRAQLGKVTLTVRSNTETGSLRAKVGEHPVGLPDRHPKLR